MELRYWIRAFGDEVEVIQPKPLEMNSQSYQKAKKNMTNIKPNSIEAVMFFALYICAQDKKLLKKKKRN